MSVHSTGSIHDLGTQRQQASANLSSQISNHIKETVANEVRASLRASGVINDSPPAIGSLHSTGPVVQASVHNQQRGSQRGSQRTGGSVTNQASMRASQHQSPIRASQQRAPGSVHSNPSVPTPGSRRSQTPGSVHSQAPMPTSVYSNEAVPVSTSQGLPATPGSVHSQAAVPTSVFSKGRVAAQIPEINYEEMASQIEEEIRSQSTINLEMGQVSAVANGGGSMAKSEIEHEPRSYKEMAKASQRGFLPASRHSQPTSDRHNFNATESPWTVKPVSHHRTVVAKKHGFAERLDQGYIARGGGSRDQMPGSEIIVNAGEDSEEEEGDPNHVLVTVERSNGDNIQGLMDENVLHVAAKMTEITNGNVSKLNEILEMTQALHKAYADGLLPMNENDPETSIAKRVSRLITDKDGSAHLHAALGDAERKTKRSTDENAILSRISEMTGGKLDDAHCILDKEEHRRNVASVTGIDLDAVHDHVTGKVLEHHHKAHGLKIHSTKAHGQRGGDFYMDMSKVDIGVNYWNPHYDPDAPEYFRGYGYRGPGMGYGSVYEKNPDWQPLHVRGGAGTYRAIVNENEGALPNRVSSTPGLKGTFVQPPQKPAWVTHAQWNGMPDHDIVETAQYRDPSEDLDDNASGRLGTAMTSFAGGSFR